MSPAGTSRKVQEIYWAWNYEKYLSRFIRDKTRGIDPDIGTNIGINSSALKVGCPPPGHGGKFREISQNRVGTTYVFSTIAVEYGVVDLHIGACEGINSPPLEVACPPPGIGAKI
jgi:hypothetical protein